jgi:hypothetical protein
VVQGMGVVCGECVISDGERYRKLAAEFEERARRETEPLARIEFLIIATNLGRPTDSGPSARGSVREGRHP